MALVFPEDLGDSQNGHAIGFTAYKSSVFAQSVGNLMSFGSLGVTDRLGLGTPQGSNLQAITTPQANIFMYVPAGGQSAMNWEQEHVYTDVKLAKIGRAHV